MKQIRRKKGRIARNNYKSNKRNKNEKIIINIENKIDTAIK